MSYRSLNEIFSKFMEYDKVSFRYVSLIFDEEQLYRLRYRSEQLVLTYKTRLYNTITDKRGIRSLVFSFVFSDSFIVFYKFDTRKLIVLSPSKTSSSKLASEFRKYMSEIKELSLNLEVSEEFDTGLGGGDQ